MNKTYVILRRVQTTDYIFIMNENEARENNWIDADGNRKWFAQTERETCPTFVWGFDSFDKANTFYEALSGEMGITVHKGEVKSKPKRSAIF